MRPIDASWSSVMKLEEDNLPARYWSHQSLDVSRGSRAIRRAEVSAIRRKAHDSDAIINLSGCF